MEYANEGALNTYLQSLVRKPTILMLKNIARQTLCGMEYLESQNIVHCDLAARNLLVSSNGPSQIQIKISDFGMGKVLINSDSYYTRIAK
jgi:serine/threonine protein kinase